MAGAAGFEPTCLALETSAGGFEDHYVTITSRSCTLNDTKFIKMILSHSRRPFRQFAKMSANTGIEPVIKLVL